MKRTRLKEWWRRFRIWQERPYHFRNKSCGVQHCANCGTVLNDNYCSRCGQAASVKGVTWDTIRNGVMEMWNVESRSILTTLWQLLLRPGHLIDDYLCGKWQTCYPPVKMLLMVAVGIDIIRYIFGFAPNHFVSETDATLQGTFLVLYDHWATENQGWSYLIQGVLCILPTWVIFRNSPRHHHHSLPEGFFIQVFIGSLSLLLDFVADYMDKWVGLFVLAYYFAIYHHVFGYRVWGTIWRTLLSLLLSVFTMFLILMTTEIIYHYI